MEAKSQNGLKNISKAMYITARIIKIISTIFMVLLILTMIFIPVLFLMYYTHHNITIFWGESTILNNLSNIMYINPYSTASSPLRVMVVEILLCISLLRLFLTRKMFKHVEDLFINIRYSDSPFTYENIAHLKKIPTLMLYLLLLNIKNIVVSVSDISFSKGFEILFLFSMIYVFEYGCELQANSDSKIYD